MKLFHVIVAAMMGVVVAGGALLQSSTTATFTPSPFSFYLQANNSAFIYTSTYVRPNFQLSIAPEDGPTIFTLNDTTVYATLNGQQSPLTAAVGKPKGIATIYLGGGGPLPCSIIGTYPAYQLKCSQGTLWEFAVNSGNYWDIGTPKGIVGYAAQALTVYVVPV